MSTDLVDMIGAIVTDRLRAFKTAEIGEVTKVYSHSASSDKNNYQCDVKLRDSGLELKRLSLSTSRMGSVAIPNPGDVVLVQYLNGDIHSACVTGCLYNDQVRPPQAKPKEFVYKSPDSAESGIRRIWLEFPNGNSLLLDDDKFVLTMGTGTLTVNHDGDIEINSGNKNIRVTDQAGSNVVEIQPGAGQVTVKGATKVVVDAPQIELASGAMHPVVFGDQLLQYLNQIVSIYQSHVHPGELALGAFPVTPAPPVPPMPPATPALLSTISKAG